MRGHEGILKLSIDAAGGMTDRDLALYGAWQSLRPGG